MMDTREVIENCFRDLVEESSYKNVSVSDICKEAHVSRRTFYGYFHNKADVVRSYFKRNTIDSMRFIHVSMEYLSPEELTQIQCAHLYQTIKKDADYYMRLAGDSLGDSGGVLVQSVTDAVYAYNKEVFARLLGTHEDGWRIDYAAYFFAASQAMFLKKWLQDGLAISPEDLGNLYAQMAVGFWESVRTSWPDLMWRICPAYGIDAHER